MSPQPRGSIRAVDFESFGYFGKRDVRSRGDISTFSRPLTINSPSGGTSARIEATRGERCGLRDDRTIG